MTLSRLSLVATYDDLVRNTKVLTEGIEGNFARFVQNQDLCRRKWLESVEETKQLRSRIKKLEVENNTLNTKLDHIRSTLDHELKRRFRAEQEREKLDRMVSLVRELLTDKKNKTLLNDNDLEKLAFINNYQPSRVVGTSNHDGMSTINESLTFDISYDPTDDDLDVKEVSYLRSGKRWKRPSAPPEEELTPPEKRHRNVSGSRRRSRSDNNALYGSQPELPAIIPEEPIDVTTEHKRKSSRKSSRHRRHQSAKENFVDTDSESYWGSQQSRRNRNNNHTETHTPELEVNKPLTRINSGSNTLLNRAHTFVSRTVIRPESCIPCGKRIRFGRLSMKCKECRATCHPECKDSVPLPCVATTTTPATNSRTPTAGPVISDYAPRDPPYIPALVVHCINEIEARGLAAEGLYRLSGTSSEVQDLKEKFLRGRGNPNLALVEDLNVICGCLKDFLRNLKEPLITFKLWEEFVTAAEKADQEEKLSSTYQAISKLPQANRDTLAFIILHLQRIAETEECRMPTASLAKVFGPTIIGYSVPSPEPMQMFSETRQQQQVVETLMTLQADYWVSYINVDADCLYNTEHQTPEMSRGVPHSMLGPLSGTVDGNVAEKRSIFGSATPRFGSKSKHPNKKPTHFFSSPKLR